MERNIPRHDSGAVARLYEPQDPQCEDTLASVLLREPRVDHEMGEKYWSSSLSDRKDRGTAEAIFHCRDPLRWDEGG